MGECTCTISMMADHNAICKACSEKQGKAVHIGVQSYQQETKTQVEQCTCDTRMMADHNAICKACSPDVTGTGLSTKLP
jgi:hypothetical protein